ncbi:MAG TPA: AAA family ATPase, partial [Candidatus Aminicenantes bacterium]|nr:AAA family ATPase [Candidatus Aminicenantes bacterium]
MSQSMIPRPLYLDRLGPLMGTGVIKVLTGMRRVGKSSLLKLLAEVEEGRKTPQPLVYLNMESLEHEPLREYRPFYQEVKRRLGGRRGLVLVDEVQEIAGWER